MIVFVVFCAIKKDLGSQSEHANFRRKARAEVVICHVHAEEGEVEGNPRCRGTLCFSHPKFVQVRYVTI